MEIHCTAKFLLFIFYYILFYNWRHRFFLLVLPSPQGPRKVQNTVQPPVSAYRRWSLKRAKTILGQNIASLAYGNCWDVLNVLLMLKVNFEKKRYFPLRNFHLLYYQGMRWCYNTLLSNLCSIICQVVAYRRLKTKENFKLLALKGVAVAYDRWSLTRGSKYSDLTW